MIIEKYNYFEAEILKNLKSDISDVSLKKLTHISELEINIRDFYVHQKDKTDYKYCMNERYSYK